MSRFFPGMTCTAIIRTRETAPEIPELADVATIDHNAGRYHPDTATEIRIGLEKLEPERLARIIDDSGVRVCRYFITPYFDDSEFWKDPPDDCVGAVLQPDGTVSTPKEVSRFQAIPLDEPLYINGRPEADTEHRSKTKPHVLQAGGTTIVSDELLATLRKLGAQGETNTLIYRGFNKATYDTVQAGFLRFRPQPEYEMPVLQLGGFDFLPESPSHDFGICGMIRNYQDDHFYDVALDRSRSAELRRLRRSVMMTPIFRHGGETHGWVTDLMAVLDRLQSR